MTNLYDQNELEFDQFETSDGSPYAVDPEEIELPEGVTLNGRKTILS